MSSLAPSGRGAHSGLHGDDSARPRSAGSRAYEWIVTAILAGDFAEGEFLDEGSLAQSVGASRTPVREALQRLQAERFVELVPRRGAQVRVITAREMEEVYQARFIVESHAIRDVCARRLGAPAAAAEIVAQMEEAGRARDWNRSAQLDQRLHSAIVHHHGNEVLAEMYDALRPRQVRLAVRTVTTAPERLDTISREHRELVAALDAHDADRAVSVLATHLREVPELVRAFPAG